MTLLRKAACAALTILGCSAAGAADLRSGRSLPPAPPLPEFYSWTGVYAGLQGGYSWDRDRTRQFTAVGRLPLGSSSGADSDTVLGGAHAGFNYQMGALVLGAEADIEAVDAQSRFAGPGLAIRVRRDWQASLRGRVGYAFDRIMIYGSGGVAFTDVESRYDDAVSRLGETSTASRTGWTAGAGVNYAMTDHLILGMDYRYTDYGRFDDVSRVALPGLTVAHNPTMHALRASIAYKF